MGSGLDNLKIYPVVKLSIPDPVDSTAFRTVGFHGRGYAMSYLVD